MALTLEFGDAEAAVLLDRLGLPEDTTDTQLILDTLKDALRSAPLTADSPPSQIAAAAKKHDLEVIPTRPPSPRCATTPRRAGRSRPLRRSRGSSAPSRTRSARARSRRAGASIG